MKWLKTTSLGFAKGGNIPEDFEDAKTDLYPIVRTRSIAEIFELNETLRNGNAPRIPTEPLSEHLVVCLAYDIPLSLSIINDEPSGIDNPGASPPKSPDAIEILARVKPPHFEVSYSRPRRTHRF